ARRQRSRGGRAPDESHAVRSVADARGETAIECRAGAHRRLSRRCGIAGPAHGADAYGARVARGHRSLQARAVHTALPAIDLSIDAIVDCPDFPASAAAREATS